MRRIVVRGLAKLAKIEWIRKSIPSMQPLYEAYILGNQDVKKALDSVRHERRSGRRRALFFWKWAPRKYWGGGVLNLLGLAFVRYFYRNISYRRRFDGKAFPYPELAKSGVQLYPGLITQELVVRLRAFHQKYAANISHYFEDFSELIICNTKGITQQNQDYLDLTEEILNKAGIIKIGQELTGKKISLYPFVSILHSTSNAGSKEQKDGQNIPHVDVFYPSYKIFIYLNEVTADNGAFRYLRGSQVFSWKNAVNYYKGVINYYFGGGKKKIYPTDASQTLYKNDYQWLDACGHPGDGVLFNVQGIHRRGEFKKDQFRERLVLLIDFRQVEVPVQRLAANA